MKKIRTFSLFIILLTTTFYCKKGDLGGGDSPQMMMQGWLRDGPWQLISATSKNNDGSSLVYKGNLSDTLFFAYTADRNQNIVSTVMCSYIDGKNYKCNYQYIGSTVICNPAWKNEYSDTLFLKNFSENLLVFNIRYNNTNGTGVETDSLKKIRFW